MTFSIDSEMDGYYAQDRLQELWQQIGSLHLSYLEMEESPQKLEQRNKLEDCIREFLCLAPHSQKFIFRETADVLHRSASTKKDFSGYRAALGWNAIGMYAANLLNQPWRKEYKQIQLYSGFYKHQIDANLVGAEVIFEAMGYKHDGDGILVLDEPICPDRVISISQDSLIAYVECQILKAIWEEVSTNFKVTWLEVLEFRETHLCSPKQSVQALNYRFHERQFQQHTRSYSQGTDPFTTGARYSSSVHPSSTLSANHSFPPLHSHASIASIPIAPPQCIYGTNGCYSNNYATYAPVAPQPIPYHVPLTYAQSVAKPLYHPTNYFPNGYTVPPPPPPYVCPTIPTGQLIEVDSQTPHHYDTVDGPSHSRTGRSRSSEIYNIKNDLKNNSDKDDPNADTIDSWDYVYRNLESQGYSKDLGERGDVLSPTLDSRKLKTSVKEAKKVKSNVALEDTIYNLSLNDKSKKDRERRNSDASKSYEHDKKLSESGTNTTAVKKQLTKQVLNGYVKTNNTLPLPEKVSSTVNGKIDRSTTSKTLDVRKQKQGQEGDKSKLSRDSDSKQMLNGSSSTNKWQCTTCTYLNDGARDICEICGKSKIKVQDIMEIGGSQCPRCTLVNPKDNKVCDACAGSLKDSPTYI